MAFRILDRPSNFSTTGPRSAFILLKKSKKSKKSSSIEEHIKQIIHVKLLKHPINFYQSI